eukprot:2105392-Pleurochrysis_carterae.AAC.4
MQYYIPVFSPGVNDRVPYQPLRGRRSRLRSTLVPRRMSCSIQMICKDWSYCLNNRMIIWQLPPWSEGLV